MIVALLIVGGLAFFLGILTVMVCVIAADKEDDSNV